MAETLAFLSFFSFLNLIIILIKENKKKLTLCQRNEQKLETNVSKNVDFNIPVYYRYVDDTIMFILNEKTDEVLTSFKNYHDRFQFTHQIENEHNLINFLNLTIIKNEDNSIKTNWFRKKTYSGRFFNYFSNHRFRQKNGIIKNFVDSAILLPDKSFHNGTLILSSTIYC